MSLQEPVSLRVARRGELAVVAVLEVALVA
jgi:hypothetical protein